MKSKASSKGAKITVDIFMVFFLTLSFIRWDGGPAFHFIVGTACTLFFAIHIFIHREWLRIVTKSYFAGKLNHKVKGKYTINVLLLVVWGIAILTGFLAVGPYMIGIEGSILGKLHGATARLGLLLVVIHIFQHIPQIKSYIGIKKPGNLHIPNMCI
jgi:hypothetical protein